MKKLCALFLSLAMSVTFLSACGTPNSSSGQVSTGGNETSTTGSGTAASTDPEVLIREKYDEPVKVRIVLGYRGSENPDTPEDLTPENATAVKKLKELYNIELEYMWIVNTDQFEAKFGAELAAGNLPDVMYINPKTFEDLQKQGGLQDISAIYEKYATEDIKKVVNYDGKLLNAGIREDGLYGLPMSTYPGQFTSQTYYRMDYLRNIGITSEDQLPKTLSEFEELCDKLMESDFDKDGVTGQPILPANKWFFDAQLGDFSPVFHAYGTYPDGWVDNGSGKLEYAGINSEIKKPLELLNKWYGKGYFAKDFAAQDIWAANSPVVNDIVAGKYPIVFGSWWISNWPLNMNLAEQPEAEWVIGPTLTVDGNPQSIMVPRYPVNNFVAVSKDCKHPEVIFKMMQWSIDYGRETNDPEFEKNATPEQILEKNCSVYTWLPWRTYYPLELVENYKFLNAEEKLGHVTFETVQKENTPNNSGYSALLSNYIKYHEGDKTADTWPAIWGYYFSRMAPNGGVARMEELYRNGKLMYNEVYITTDTMITKKTQIDNYRDTTMLSMIMGEIPLSEFDQFVEKWNNLGGREIEAEVNEWFSGL